jgi:hypothetical protein
VNHRTHTRRSRPAPPTQVRERVANPLQRARALPERKPEHCDEGPEGHAKQADPPLRRHRRQGPRHPRGQDPESVRGVAGPCRCGRSIDGNATVTFADRKELRVGKKVYGYQYKPVSGSFAISVGGTTADGCVVSGGYTPSQLTGSLTIHVTGSDEGTYGGEARSQATGRTPRIAPDADGVDPPPRPVLYPGFPSWWQADTAKLYHSAAPKFGLAQRELHANRGRPDRLVDVARYRHLTLPANTALGFAEFRTHSLEVGSARRLRRPTEMDDRRTLVTG